MDTGQPGLAPENVALSNAADAFKAFTTEPKEDAPRDELGRFAPEEVEEDDETEATEAVEAGEEDETDDTAEAVDETQPETVELPSSWSKEDAELWESLPAEAQAKIAERERERDAGLNSKLQEAANARKAVEQQAAEANANRDRYAQAIDEVLSLTQVQRPDPIQYGLGTSEFDRDSYEIALYQYEQQSETVQFLAQQRREIAAQQAQESERQQMLAKQEIEQVAWPKFLADVPELADPTKGKPIIDEVVKYAISMGIPEHLFTDPENVKTITSAELHIAWKAQQYDRIEAAEQRVKATNPPPRPAAPAVRPGGVASRQGVQANRLGKAQARLAKEGTPEAAAAVFKHFMR